MPSIRSLMTTKLVTARPETSVRDAIELLIEHQISGLPVVNEQYRVVGVLTEKDVLKAFYEKASDVSSLMTRDPTMVSVSEPLVEVFDILMSNSFRRLLVHENGRLVGLVSRSDLMPVVLEALLERLP